VRASELVSAPQLGLLWETRLVLELGTPLGLALVQGLERLSGFASVTLLGSVSVVLSETP
jgi:hypothetical protein